MNFTPSELQFINGLLVLCGGAFILRLICFVIFAFTTSDKDMKSLKNYQEGTQIQLARHTGILSVIIYTLGLFIFFNTAIIGAMVLRSLI